MKLLVIGHSVVDRIKIDDKITVKPGGIFYTSIGLLNFINSGDEVHICSKMDKKNYRLFEDVYKNFNLSKIDWVDKIATVELVIFEKNERREHYDTVPESLSLQSELDYGSFDGILINMINGVDISFDDLKLIRKSFSGPIYFDVHTLSRGVGSNNHRYFRTIPDADKWFSQLDIVQANEYEILTFCDSDDERYIAEWTLNLGVSHLIVTKGAYGVTYYTLDKNSSLLEKYIKAEPYNSLNKVGCGDIFGAAAFFYFLASGDMMSSVKRANRAAGLVTTFTEIEQFYSLKEHMGNIND